MNEKHPRQALRTAVVRTAAGAIIGLTIAVGLLIGTAASATSAPPTIVIGTKNFPEEFILGELYKQALQAKGFDVSYKENIGSTEIVQTQPHESGKIELLPRVHRGDRAGRVRTHQLAENRECDLQASPRSLEAAKGYTLLNPTLFYDTGRARKALSPTQPRKSTG